MLNYTCHYIISAHVQVSFFFNIYSSLIYRQVIYGQSKESIDAAIGDVLSKPWLPLPLGLKPPAVDSVLGELQRQGVPKIPPTCA